MRVTIFIRRQITEEPTIIHFLTQQKSLLKSELSEDCVNTPHRSEFLLYASDGVKSATCEEMITDILRIATYSKMLTYGALAHRNWAGSSCHLSVWDSIWTGDKLFSKGQQSPAAVSDTGAEPGPGKKNKKQKTVWGYTYTLICIVMVTHHQPVISKCSQDSFSATVLWFISVIKPTFSESAYSKLQSFPRAAFMSRPDFAHVTFSCFVQWVRQSENKYC